MKTVCTIEARMRSSRLPGKVLAPVMGRPMLEHMIERLRRSTRIDAIVVATSTDESCDPIEALCHEVGVGCFRGSEDDVLERVLCAAQAAGADLIVQTTADCPLIDPNVVDRVIAAFRRSDSDYCSNTLQRTYPRGLDVQVFPTKVLAEVDRLTRNPSDREHVSLYIYEHPERYRLKSVESADPTLGAWRLTVDTPEDLALVRSVFEELYPSRPDFGLGEIVELLRARPELLELNAHVEQKPVGE